MYDDVTNVLVICRSQIENKSDRNNYENLANKNVNNNKYHNNQKPASHPLFQTDGLLIQHI